MTARPALLALLGALALAGCRTSAPSHDGDARALRAGAVRPLSLVRDFGPTDASSPYYAVRRQGDGLVVSNTSLGSGVTPIVCTAAMPPRVAWTVRGRIESEGLDGGWGIEFGVQGAEAYRALIYASGRFCLDRLAGDYPEFLHCVTQLPAVRGGEAENELGLRLDGPRIRVFVNGRLAVDLEDERLRPGAIGVAVAGAGARVRFSDLELRDPGSEASSPPR